MGARILYEDIHIAPFTADEGTAKIGDINFHRRHFLTRCTEQDLLEKALQKRVAQTVILIGIEPMV
jgi:hypothetical protein